MSVMMSGPEQNPSSSRVGFLQAPGPTVADTVPEQHESVVRESPNHVRDVPLNRFEAKVVHGDNDDLKFRPTILKPWPTTFLVVLYLSVASSIAILWQLSNTNHQYQLSSENVHMISRYFPSLIGTITVLLFRSTVREFIRMTPYIAMADQEGRQTAGEEPWKSVNGAFFPWQDFSLTPGVTSFISLFCQFIASFVVSLKVALFASTKRDEHWILTVRFYPAAALIGGYSLMAVYTVFIAFKLKGKSTGLKWDLVSIADYVSLFAHCNVTDYFEPLELRHEASAKSILSSARLFRLGYWEKFTDGGNPPETVYGIGFSWKASEDGFEPTVRTQGPKQQAWYQKCLPSRHKDEPLPLSEHRSTGCAHGVWPKCEHYPYRHNPGCPRWVIWTFTIIVWCALAASIAALIKGIAFNGFQLINDWNIPSNLSMVIDNKTFKAPPIDPADPKSTLLIYALLFRSAPTYVAGLFTSTIIEWLDLNMRFMQPFVNMFEEPGDASQTVLLAYITLSSLQVPITAYDKGHYKVSFYSTLNTLSPLFPVFIGGLLTVSGDPNKVHFKFSLSAYIGILVFLLFYSIALPLAIPLPNRLLPRQFFCMADLMAMCHEARFLGSPHLKISDRKRTPSKEHMTSRILLSGDRFLFGKYKGRDNNWHLGFDVRDTRKADYGDLQDTHLVEWIKPEGLGETLREATVRASTFIAGWGRDHYMPLQRDIFGTRAASVGHEEHSDAIEMASMATSTGRQQADDGVGERSRRTNVSSAAGTTI